MISLKGINQSLVALSKVQLVKWSKIYYYHIGSIIKENVFLVIWMISWNQKKEFFFESPEQ